jgi:hypothetical protein
MLKRLADADRLIALLRLHPGLTKRALLSLHDIAPGLIYRCVAANLIRVRAHVVGHRSGRFNVYRFYAKEEQQS